MGVDRSRSLRLAAGATSHNSDLERHLDTATVVVSVDAEIPQALLTAGVLLGTLRRGLGALVLVDTSLPDAFITKVQAEAEAIDPNRGLSIAKEREARKEQEVRIHIGPVAPWPAIRVVPEGFGAHVAGASRSVITLRRAATPLGAIYAASLGAAEAFKHTASVRTDRRVLHRHLRFCPVSLSDDLYAASDPPALVDLNLTLVGAGAIGTGIVLLLDALGASGRILLVDNQRFGKENVATYSLGALPEIGEWKVEIARHRLTKFDVIPVHEPIADLLRSVDAGELPWSPIVFSAVDSPEARRDVQRLWPDRLIDGQTGDTMLGIRDHRHGVDPCMHCVFPVDRDARSGADVLAERLGLSVQELADPDAVLTDAHLHGKTEEQLQILRPHLGTPMCGLAQATGLSTLDAADFMPSVPFVSLQAACLSIGRMIAIAFGSSRASDTNLVQYDGLFGPQAATLELMKIREGCMCQTRAASIQAARASRSSRRAR